MPAWRRECCLVCDARGGVLTWRFIVSLAAFLLAVTLGACLLETVAVCGGDSRESGLALSGSFSILWAWKESCLVFTLILPVFSSLCGREDRNRLTQIMLLKSLLQV